MPAESWKKYKSAVQASLIVICLGLLLYALLQNFSVFAEFLARVVKILEPIIYGIIFAYLMTPVCNYFNERFLVFFKKHCKSKDSAEKAAHYSSVTLSIIILMVCIFVLIMLILPQLFGSISEIYRTFPERTNEITNLIHQDLAYNPTLETQVASLWTNTIRFIKDTTTNLTKMDINDLLGSVSRQVLSFATSIMNFAIGFIVAFYCLSSRHTFSLQSKKIIYAILNRKQAAYFLDKVDLTNRTFQGFIVGKIIDSLIIGIICFICTWLIGTPQYVLVSVIIGITNIIPFFGPFIGAIPCTLIILLESPLQALYFIIFIFLLQQFDGNILGPKILGDSTGLSSFWVLFSILLFGGLWGIAGMIIAVPLFAVIYSLIREFTDERLTQRHLPTQAWAYETDVPNMDACSPAQSAPMDKENGMDTVEGTCETHAKPPETAEPRDTQDTKTKQ